MPKFLKMEQRSEEWYIKRNGKVCGTGLQKILSGTKANETYLYETIASRLSPNLIPTEENARDRGIRLEPRAREAFEKAYQKDVEQFGFIESDEYPNMGYSPDGVIKVKGEYTEDIEIKCPQGANYIRALIDNKIPKEYMPQNVQAFIVNPFLNKRYFILYNPDIEIKPMLVFELVRKDIASEIEEYREKEMAFLQEVDEVVERLSF